ncbi:ARM REPEAT PROTEIN INTERACTING WITH ABF2-like isoform X1 [Phaseolus vulgaris]|uniref:ARM REPEAT PROTEIN INTERACTING WITH ABF2-like isoform X1 n=1 Tax=Phaseolus vulgaris TaxID=3885 RepID=UPI0035CC9E60
MENPNTVSRGLKRKPEGDLSQNQSDFKAQCLSSKFRKKILRQVSLLNSTTSDPLTLQKAIHNLSVLAEDEDLVDTVLDCGVVPALVRHFKLPDARNDDNSNIGKDSSDRVIDHEECEMAKGCALIIELLAVKQEYQDLIVGAGALPCLVESLKKHKICTISQPLINLLKRAADAITSLAHENSDIKTCVRREGGIPPLVELLEFGDIKVQRAAARTLRTLAFKNDGNKNQVVIFLHSIDVINLVVLVVYKIKKLQIVECDALPTLVLMLGSEDSKLHSEAIGVIGNLVHSSPNIKKDVLLAGALQPVICSLSSSSYCSESRREAALLLGQFATTDSDCKVHIAQRGAIPPLVDMLKSSDAELQEMSSFALGRLAQDSHNQAGIAQSGGIEPLLKLLDSKKTPVQQNVVFALYGLSDNEDNVVCIIKADGFQRLKAGNFKNQQTVECAMKTLKRLEEKTQGRVLKQLIRLMCYPEEVVQRRVAIALAYLCSPRDSKTIFIDNRGLNLLLDMLKSPNVRQMSDASAALHKLAAKAHSSVVSLFELPPPSPSPQVYLGEEYVNNPKLSDITFLVEGRTFYAHRDCLVSSDIFRAMFDGSYREREAKNVVIPNIKWDVFELMMRFIYTGTVDVSLDMAQDLLRAADQYLLDGLKRICEYAIIQEISVENVVILYKVAEDFNATSLRHACILFMLEKFDVLRSEPWYCSLVHHILPNICMFFSTLLVKSHPVDL